MDITITLNPTEMATVAAKLSAARDLSDYPETLFGNAANGWIEDVADDRTLTYGTCLWFTDAMSALLALKVFKGAGEAAFLLDNTDTDPNADDPRLYGWPRHVVLTSWDVWEVVEFVTETGSEQVDEIGNEVEAWLNTEQQ